MSATIKNLDDELEGVWETLPDDFVCPECGCGKEDYEVVDME
jgi:rubredoxin